MQVDSLGSSLSWVYKRFVAISPCLNYSDSQCEAVLEVKSGFVELDTTMLLRQLPGVIGFSAEWAPASRRALIALAKV